MFDVAGLPLADDGAPAFKMNYNTRTEFNVCYDVRGRVEVRMAVHPYRASGQSWGPWIHVDALSTYHINEAAGGPEEERSTDPASGTPQTARNKHEVRIVDGHVTLFCLFDPAPTGIERHRPGEYSDDVPAATLPSELRDAYYRALAEFDPMVDELSLAKARGQLGRLRSPMIVGGRRREDQPRAD